MKKFIPIISFIFLLIIAFNCKKVQAPSDFAGEWTIAGDSNVNLTIWLDQENNIIKGFHLAQSQDGSKSDINIREAQNLPTINAVVNGNKASGTFNYLNIESKGEIELSLDDQGKLHWKLFNVTESDNFLPAEAVLEK